MVPGHLVIVSHLCTHLSLYIISFTESNTGVASNDLSDSNYIGTADTCEEVILVLCCLWPYNSSSWDLGNQFLV